MWYIDFYLTCVLFLVIKCQCNWSIIHETVDSIFNYMNKFSLIKIISNWFVETWSNASLTFKNKHDVINFCFKINWISCVKINIASIADRFFRFSIWLKSSIFDICFKYDNRLAMIFFEIFFKQFSKIMIRYDFDIFFLLIQVYNLYAVNVDYDRLVAKYNIFRIFEWFDHKYLLL